MDALKRKLLAMVLLYLPTDGKMYRNCWYFTAIVASRVFWKLWFNYCVPEINIGSI